MTTKLLNLDEVASDIEKEITLGGETYPMESISVDDYINLVRKEEELAKKEEVTGVENFDFLFDVVASSFPTMPKEVIGKLKLQQLTAIMDFIKADAEAGKSEKSVGKSQKGKNK